MSQILVVDDDPVIVTMVAHKLRECDYAVHCAEHGRQALKLLSSTRTDLVITDVLMPQMDGWAFVRELRARPECAFLPVIFLTELNSADDRIKGFRLGADDYLAKPFKAEELLLRVARTLQRGERLHRQAQSSIERTAGFEGSLDQVGISSLLMLLEMERKTGELVVTRRREKGLLQLRGGKLLSAALQSDRAPAVARGAECIYYLLQWCEGRFSFTPREITAEDEVRATTTALLMEGARRLDEKRSA